MNKADFGINGEDCTYVPRIEGFIQSRLQCQGFHCDYDFYNNQKCSGSIGDCEVIDSKEINVCEVVNKFII